MPRRPNRHLDALFKIDLTNKEDGTVVQKVVRDGVVYDMQSGSVRPSAVARGNSSLKEKKEKKEETGNNGNRGKRESAVDMARRRIDALMSTCTSTSSSSSSMSDPFLLLHQKKHSNTNNTNNNTSMEGTNRGRKRDLSPPPEYRAPGRRGNDLDALLRIQRKDQLRLKQLAYISRVELHEQLEKER